jgi:hypothetical protein
MLRIPRTFESSLFYALFTSAVVGVIAWNWREKCISGTGFLSEFGFGCPSTTMLVIAVLALALTVFVYSMWRGRRERNQPDDKGRPE